MMRSFEFVLQCLLVASADTLKVSRRRDEATTRAGKLFERCYGRSSGSRRGRVIAHSYCALASEAIGRAVPIRSYSDMTKREKLEALKENRKTIENLNREVSLILAEESKSSRSGFTEDFRLEISAIQMRRPRLDFPDAPNVRPCRPGHWDDKKLTM